MKMVLALVVLLLATPASASAEKTNCHEVYNPNYESITVECPEPPPAVRIPIKLCPQIGIRGTTGAEKCLDAFIEVQGVRREWIGFYDLAAHVYIAADETTACPPPINGFRRYEAFMAWAIGCVSPE
jgi:hypothetical protein